MRTFTASPRRGKDAQSYLGQESVWWARLQRLYADFSRCIPLQYGHFLKCAIYLPGLCPPPLFFPVNWPRSWIRVPNPLESPPNMPAMSPNPLRSPPPPPN